ncbi:hypothetical protein [Stackebrandtia soli]|uniref:glycoside hydrolase family 26 protein n=1 Tax=Stackebrandtia soli TaxID=1892856 RepID=UPI0039EA9DD6
MSVFLAMTIGSTYGLITASGADLDSEEAAGGVFTSDADGYTLSGRSDLNIPDTTRLLVGAGPEGVSVAYVQFDMGVAHSAEGATVTVAIAKTRVEDLVEIAQVSSEWAETSLTAESAPLFGPVLDSQQVTGDTGTVTFDVSAADLTGPSAAFALTTPSTEGQIHLVARESRESVPALRVPAATIPSAAPSPSVVTPSQSSVASQPSDVPTAVPPPPSTAPSTVPPSSGVSQPSDAPSSAQPQTAPDPASVPGATRPTPLPPPGVGEFGAPTTEPGVHVPTPRVPSPVGPQDPPGPHYPIGPPPAPSDCAVGDDLVPTCGALQGIAPAGKTPVSKTAALLDYETKVDKRQHVYHSYHRGTSKMFPTDDEIEVARDPLGKRLLFINWKPQNVTWAEIAAGDAETDAYLDRLAQHIKSRFNEPFFFTVHHEPENDVRESPGSGYTADDYAAMFRHVVERLRGGGADQLVSVIVYMAYLKWTTQPWHERLYPGDDVVDWVAWDSYGYSDPGYGHGDFAELVNRTADSKPDWPGTYRWAARTFPNKPLMIGEWGVWYSRDNAGHQAEVFESAGAQMGHFPRLKAVLYFESPNAEGRSSQVDSTPHGLVAFQRWCDSRQFDVAL